MEDEDVSMRYEAIVTLAAMLMLAGCVTDNGLVAFPEGWAQPVMGSKDCSLMSGKYTSEGMPAEDNSSDWLRAQGWPIIGSLESILVYGINRIARSGVHAVQIEVVENEVKAISLMKGGSLADIDVLDFECVDGRLFYKGNVPSDPGESSLSTSAEILVSIERALDGALLVRNHINVNQKWFVGAVIPHQERIRFLFRFPLST